MVTVMLFGGTCRSVGDPFSVGVVLEGDGGRNAVKNDLVNGGGYSESEACG